MITPLSSWFETQIANAGEVRIEGLDRVDVGHSAEMIMLTVVWESLGVENQRDVVLRLRPPPPGLLEPYDLQRQFDVLRALEATAVRAPKALWIEPTGDVLGRPFFVMERAVGEVYERVVPDDFGPDQIRKMTEDVVDQIAAIHRVDLATTGLCELGHGHDYLDRELDRWANEMRRVQRGPLPALERLYQELRTQQPEPSAHATLVHGDAKPGNFAFVGDKVSAVFDWELADIGDPLADIGYAEVLWAMPVGLTSRAGSLTADELVARYEDRSGVTVRNREWYRASQAYKLAVIMLLGSMLFDAGHSDDLRLAEMALGVEFVTRAGLDDLGVTEELPAGPVVPRNERVQEAQAQARVDTAQLHVATQDIVMEGMLGTYALLWHFEWPAERFLARFEQELRVLKQLVVDVPAGAGQ